MLCPFPRPNLVSQTVYEQIRGVCRGIFRAIEKAEARLGEGLWDRVDVTPEERELVRIDPGYARSSPTSRLDSFVTTNAYQFVELNAESPAGIAYAEVLVDLFLELPIVQRFQERYRLKRFHSREAMLSTLVACYREAGGTAAKPLIAIVDYEDVPTRTEHHLFRDFFESRGYPSLVCDPRHLTYEGGRLRHDGREIDIVYKRLLVNEFLERITELQPLLQAATGPGGHAGEPVPLQAHPQEGHLRGADRRRAPAAVHSRRARRHRRPRALDPARRSKGRTTRDGREIDLVPHVRGHRDGLVLKPNDEYGGKGVHIGWEMTESQWDAALAEALASSYVVQAKVDLQRETFPEIGPGGLQFRDLVVDLDPFVFNGEVEGFLTRLSGTSLANVTSGGGQVPAFLVEPVS